MVTAFVMRNFLKAAAVSLGIFAGGAGTGAAQDFGAMNFGGAGDFGTPQASGTSKATVENFIQAGFSVLLDIDVQGAASFRRLYPNECCTLFISPPDLMTLEQRLRDRGTDSEETILKRVANAREEMKAAPLFDHIVVNDDLDRAFQNLQTHVRKALHG